MCCPKTEKSVYDRMSLLPPSFFKSKVIMNKVDEKVKLREVFLLIGLVLEKGNLCTQQVLSFIIFSTYVLSVREGPNTGALISYLMKWNYVSIQNINEHSF